MKIATTAKAAADKALAAADEAGKPAAQTKATAAAKTLTDATAAKAIADKALAAINAQVIQATTVNTAAAKSLTEAQNAAKTGKVALTKLLAVLATAANTEQGKVTAAGAALTAAQKNADLLRLNKTYSEYYHARNQLAAQEAERVPQCGHPVGSHAGHQGRHVAAATPRLLEQRGHEQHVSVVETKLFLELFEQGVQVVLLDLGVELANGFHELTDLDEQRIRFEADMDLKDELYAERYPIDEDFLAALSEMPDASGVALGFDRLVVLASGARSINDVIWTPFPA